MGEDDVLAIVDRPEVMSECAGRTQECMEVLPCRSVEECSKERGHFEGTMEHACRTFGGTGYVSRAGRAWSRNLVSPGDEREGMPGRGVTLRGRYGWERPLPRFCRDGHRGGNEEGDVDGRWGGRSRGQGKRCGEGGHDEVDVKN